MALRTYGSLHLITPQWFYLNSADRDMNSAYMVPQGASDMISTARVQSRG